MMPEGLLNTFTREEIGDLREGAGFRGSRGCGACRYPLISRSHPQAAQPGALLLVHAWSSVYSSTRPALQDRKGASFARLRTPTWKDRLMPSPPWLEEMGSM